MLHSSTKKTFSVHLDSKLVWIDLEMSGLNPKYDVILEIAVLITDNQLNIIAEGPNFAIHHPKKLLEQMDDWNQIHHSASGLINRVQKSMITTKEAEKLILDFIRQHTKQNTSPLCGNSVAQDRRFLVKYMPEIANWLHYRNIDVSTVKELTARWWPEQHKPPRKKGVHKALIDIKESIDELIYYRQNFFSCPSK